VSILSKMKAFAEKISIEMGYGGELNLQVLREANRVLRSCGLDKHQINEDTTDKRSPYGDDELRKTTETHT
jgi:hypothetical protein